MGNLGNTFDNGSVNYGHARKVWREVRHVYPAGGTVTNVADWLTKKVIPSGTPLKFDAATNEITAYTDAAIAAAVTAPDEGEAPGLASLGINGYSQEDIPIINGSTVGTATVVYGGEIYGYMFEEETLAQLKTLTNLPMIVFVQ